MCSFGTCAFQSPDICSVIDHKEETHGEGTERKGGEGSKRKKSEDEHMDEEFVPRGKRSRLEESDGEISPSSPRENNHMDYAEQFGLKECSVALSSVETSQALDVEVGLDVDWCQPEAPRTEGAKDRGEEDEADEKVSSRLSSILFPSEEHLVLKEEPIFGVEDDYGDPEYKPAGAVQSNSRRTARSRRTLTATATTEKPPGPGPDRRKCKDREKKAGKAARNCVCHFRNCGFEHISSLSMFNHQTQAHFNHPHYDHKRDETYHRFVVTEEKAREGRKAHFCSFCNHRTPDLTTMVVHLSTKHHVEAGMPLIDCLYCPYEAKNVYSLRNHVRVSTMVLEQRCQFLFHSKF